MSAQLQVTGEAKIRDIQGPVVANDGVITALDGLPSQYVRGDGTLADIPTVTGGGSSVSYYLNGSVNQGTFGGSTYYQMSRDAITGTGTNFSTSSDGLLAQFITDAGDPDVSSIPSGNWNIEFFMNVSASSGSLASFYVEFYKYDGSTFTLIASNSATPEQLTNTTTVDAYYTSVAFAETALATTDRLAIRIYANVASKTVTLYTEDNRLCQIVTTFSKGLLSMNSLTDQEQYLTTGTSGTNFAIVSSGDTHTFNLPVASATNTGKLSSTDWSTFNNKQDALTNPITGTGASGKVAYFDGTTSITSESSFIYDASTNRLGVNTTTPNATIGANASTDSGYSLLLKNDNANYNGIGFGTDSTYGNLIATEKLGTAPSRNLTLINQSGFISLTEAGNLGVGLLTPNTGLDIYNGTSSYLWLHTANSGVGGTDGVRLALFNTNGANLRNFEGSFSITAEGDFSIITIGAENFRVNSADGSIYQSKVSNAMLKAVSGVITAAVAGTDYLAPSAISGTTNTIPKFTSSSALGNSNITDTGSLITLGSTSYVSSGNFGVGTATPAVSGVGIDIYSATSAGLRFHTATSGTTVSDGAGINFSAANNLGISNYENGAIDIVTNGNSGVYINSSGYVGISGATPSTALTVNGAITQSSVTSSLLKTNGSGTIIAAVAGTDYVVPSALSGYLPLTGGNITGNLTIGSPASALAQFHIYNASAAATMLVQTNSSTDYAEIASRNYNSVSTAYYRQYSSSASGTDFGLSRANLATLFSNYASNFAIGTQNGGDLILGTANAERMRIAASTGNVVIGSSDTSSNKKLVVYSAIADTHLGIIGAAPSIRFQDNFTATYSALFGMATASNNYVTGSVAGDFMITYNSANNLIFGNSNTSLEKMRLNSSGNLLINTTSGISGVRLQVTDTAPILGIQSNTTGSVYLRMYQGVDVVSSMYYNAATSTLTLSNNNAGIQFNTSGVSNAFNLSSTGAATFSSSVTAAGRINSGNGGGATASLNAQQLSGDDSAIYAGGVATAGSSKGIKILAGTNTSDYALNVASYANSPILYARGDGNLGIGTSSPGVKFEVAGSGSIGFFRNPSSTAATTYITVVNANNTSNGLVMAHISDGTGYFGTQNSADLRLVTGDTERMRITSGGRVIINSTTSGEAYFNIKTNSTAYNPNAYNGNNSAIRLECGNATSAYNAISFGGGGGSHEGLFGSVQNSSGLAEFVWQTYNGSSYGERMRITSSGTIFMNNLGGYSGSFSDVRYDTSSKELFYQTSSQRYKEDITNLESTLSKINQLRAVRFKDKYTQRYNCGFIAEEVVEIIPDVVFKKEVEGFDEPQVEGINYSDFAPFTIKAVQELYDLVKEQQAQIEELKELIKSK